MRQKIDIEGHIRNLDIHVGPNPTFKVLSLGATAAPSTTTGYGKVWYDVVDEHLHFLDDTGDNIDLSNPTKHMLFNVWNPNTVQSADNEVCIWPVTPKALTITKLTLTANATANQVAGDIKRADAFIGLGNSAVVNDFDTTLGVRVDSSISSGAVPSGKCLYLSFDSAPSEDITQLSFDIEFNYD